MPDKTPPFLSHQNFLEKNQNQKIQHVHQNFNIPLHAYLYN
jgi:hypothetical protein